MAVNALERRESTLVAYEYLRTGLYKRHGVLLTDLYLEMILERRMTIRDAVLIYKLDDPGYNDLPKDKSKGGIALKLWDLL